MRNNTTDKTLKTNYIQTYQFLIEEYEQVKSGTHAVYDRVKDFYQAHRTCAQTFLKYYNRYKQSDGDLSLLVPGKRGPKYRMRRAGPEIESLVLAEREKGCNKYEIHSLLYPLLLEKTPSPSGIYRILKRHGKNKLSRPMKQEKQRIIKEKAGELAHIDCHHLSKDMIANDKKRYYLVCVIDSCTRVAWAEVIEDIKSISVMFAVLRCLNYLTEKFSIKFAEALTDNGPEFGIKESSEKLHHPFERMLIELGIKHRYTRPYRPQTNGKVERFWRTLNEDLIEGTYFESIDHFKEELFKYIIYYNKLRPHQALDGKTPEQANVHQRNM
jgi:transposase InsO family protein